MEENEYRSAYNAINERRCVFEKAILNGGCKCLQSTRFFLADREGIRCNSNKAQDQCRILLDLLRKNALFTLKIKQLEGPLPHAKELRVQTGGIQGLQQLILADSGATQSVENISGVVSDALTRYTSLELLPFQHIVPFIASFKGRQKRAPKAN